MCNLCCLYSWLIYALNVIKRLLTYSGYMYLKYLQATVTEPMAWVSSMLVVVKTDTFRIWIDPKDLNKAICCEHYHMPTFDEVVTRLTKATKFTVTDAKHGFWQKRLDTESSYKTTSNTPFGRYRWNRVQFGISSAPEVWQ